MKLDSKNRKKKFKLKERNFKLREI